MMKNLLKGIFVVTALLFALSVNAAGFLPLHKSDFPSAPPIVKSIPDYNTFDGFYIGAGAGVANTVNEINIDNHYTFIDPGTITTVTYENDNLVKSHQGDHHFTAKLFAGFGKTHNKFYAGGELFARYAPTHIKSNSNWETTVTITEDFPKGEETVTEVIDGKSTTKFSTNNYSYGAFVRIGYLTSSSTMLYVLAGLDTTKFDFKQSTTVFEQTRTVSFNKTKIGFMPGVGIETKLNDNVFVRAQYTYTDFGNIKKMMTYEEDEITDTVTVKNHPTRSIFSVDIVYRFC